MKWHQASARGFTLIETMIALALVAIALPALVTLVLAQLDGAGVMRERTYAYWVAQNELTRLQLLQREKLAKQLPNFKFPEKDSGVRDMMGVRWHWVMLTENVEGMPVPGFKRVTIYVNALGSTEGNLKPAEGARKPKSHLASLTGFINDPDNTL